MFWAPKSFSLKELARSPFGLMLAAFALVILAASAVHLFNFQVVPNFFYDQQCVADVVRGGYLCVQSYHPGTVEGLHGVYIFAVLSLVILLPFFIFPLIAKLSAEKYPIGRLIRRLKNCSKKARALQAILAAFLELLLQFCTTIQSTLQKFADYKYDANRVILSIQLREFLIVSRIGGIAAA